MLRPTSGDHDMNEQAPGQDADRTPSPSPRGKTSKRQHLANTRQAERLLCDDDGLRNLLIAEILRGTVAAAMDRFFDGYDIDAKMNRSAFTMAITDGITPLVQRMVDEQRQSTIQWGMDAVAAVLEEVDDDDAADAAHIPGCEDGA